MERSTWYAAVAGGGEGEGSRERGGGRGRDSNSSPSLLGTINIRGLKGWGGGERILDSVSEEKATLGRVDLSRGRGKGKGKGKGGTESGGGGGGGVCVSVKRDLLYVSGLQ